MLFRTIWATGRGNGNLRARVAVPEIIPLKNKMLQNSITARFMRRLVLEKLPSIEKKSDSLIV
jgi:hypothetical protein